MNYDEQLLISQRVNPTLNIPVLNQALRIAIYDEFHAFETYKKVLQKFGMVTPFTNIIQAEERHYSMLIPLLYKYGVEIPINDWANKIDIPNTLQECCEVGIVAEIDNIRMYDNLLQYVGEADVRDALYRLQAASFNNHLPAFRQCASMHFAQTTNFQNYQNSPNPQQNSFANGQKSGYEFFQNIKGLIDGKPDINAINSLLNHLGFDFLAGGALGAVIVMLLNNQFNKEEE